MAKSKKATAKDVKAAKKQEVVTQLSTLKLLGEIITWNANSGNTHKHKDVVAALGMVGLDAKVARELLPRHAFSRACKKLSDEAVIDVVKDGGDFIKFQFTKKALQKEEWKFTKETELTLNKETGSISCPKKDLQDVAQRLLDTAIEERTSADISKIVQKLFEKNGDLFSIREQGGVYFVPLAYTPFIDQVDTFLNKLGGHISRFPIPSGTPHGDRAVQESVAEAMKAVVAEHELAIDQFTVNTRRDTIENAANKIKATRVKLEAYANYLQDRSKELLDAIDAANAKLQKTVGELTTAKENAPEGPIGLFGHSMTAVIRWMGSQGWTFKEAKAVLEKKNQAASDNTIRWQLGAGKKGEPKPAELTKEQGKELEKLK